MNEILENVNLIISVLAAILAGIISFIFSLRLRRKIDSKLAGRNEEIPKPFWAEPLCFFLRIMPFAAALLIVWIMLELTGAEVI